eukprot:1183527-Prorocentrum_minimum.AAC.2
MPALTTSLLEGSEHRLRQRGQLDAVGVHDGQRLVNRLALQKRRLVHHVVRDVLQRGKGKVVRRRFGVGVVGVGRIAADRSYCERRSRCSRGGNTARRARRRLEAIWLTTDAVESTSNTLQSHLVT